MPSAFYFTRIMAEMKMPLAIIVNSKCGDIV